MVNGLGVLGWGVGGIEAEAAMLGEPLSMLVPQVVGFKLTGGLPEGATATDLVLTVTEILRQAGVVGKFVEYFGHGLASLPLADRATIGNMSPEYGATCGFFPVDELTLEYLRLTGRSAERIALVEAYCKENMLWHDPSEEPTYSQVRRARPLDRRAVARRPAPPAGPRPAHAREDVVPRRARDVRRRVRAHERQPRQGGRRHLPGERPDDRAGARAAPPSRSPTRRRSPSSAPAASASPSTGTDYELEHGSVVIAAITSCTNTSNPQVMVGAGLLAKKAVERGLQQQALGEDEPRARARRS